MDWSFRFIFQYVQTSSVTLFSKIFLILLQRNCSGFSSGETKGSINLNKISSPFTRLASLGFRCAFSSCGNTSQCRPAICRKFPARRTRWMGKWSRTPDQRWKRSSLFRLSSANTEIVSPYMKLSHVRTLPSPYCQHLWPLSVISPRIRTRAPSPPRCSPY